jgi:hypothetical protein
MLTDVVYPVRDGDANDELRWSLRCLEANYPHGQVWVVGYKPNWLINVQFIKGNLSRHAGANVYHNVLKAAQCRDISSEFVVMNDDFFITKPLDEIPILYRSTLREHLRLPSLMRSQSTPWTRSIRTTLIALQALGYIDPISYELHVPMHANREAMADTLSRFTHITPDAPPQWRSLYGNINAIGGEVGGDCKVYGAQKVRSPFHSTTDGSFRHYRSFFLQHYPKPSRYEKPKS